MILILISAIDNDGDREFMLRLYENCRSIMYWRIQEILSNKWDAEDTFQAVMEKLIDKVGKPRTMDRRGLAGYVVTAAQHTAYTVCRNKSASSLWIQSRLSATGRPSRTA